MTGVPIEGADVPATGGAATTQRTATGLLRVLGAAFGIAVIIGNTIGVGILRTPGEVAARLPSVPLFLGVWVAGGLYALLGAVSLSEPGAMIPRSGGQYVIVHRALGPFPGFVVGWSDWLSTCGSIALVSIVLGEYLGPLVPALAGREAITASTVVILFALLQWRGVRVGDATQQITSLLKTLALLGLVAAILLLPHAAQPPVAATVMPKGAALLTAAVIGLQAAIYTYDGWTGAIYFGEEIRNPGRDVPRATIGGVLLVLFIYLSINIAFLRVVAIERMAGDPFVAATAAVAVFGPHGDTVIRVLMIVSMLAAVNALQLMASRIPVAMSRDGLLPGASRVNRGGTPAPALFMGTGVALLFIATNTFDTVLSLLAFFFVASYALSFTSIFVLRRREPTTPRPYRVIGYPWTTGLALAGSIAFLVASFVGDRANTVRALLLLVASVPVFLLVRRSARPA
jgi:basic amino acid/polyamine antiporter, APA family